MYQNTAMETGAHKYTPGRSSQFVCREALKRLRKQLALEVRDDIDLGLQANDASIHGVPNNEAEPKINLSTTVVTVNPCPSASAKIARVKESFFRRNGKNTKGIGSSFAALKYMLDVFESSGASLRTTALALGVSSSQTSKLLCRDADVLMAVNKIRSAHGLKPIRSRR